MLSRFQTDSPAQIDFYFFLPQLWRTVGNTNQFPETRRHSCSNNNRPGGDQFFAPRIHLQIKALQRACAEQLQVSLLRKNDFIHSFGLVHFQNRVADRARDDLSIRHLKLQILFARLDADFRQHRTINPSRFRPSVYHKARNDRRLGTFSRVHNFAANVKKSHKSMVQPPPTRATSRMFSSNAAMMAWSPVKPCDCTFFMDCSTRP